MELVPYIEIPDSSKKAIVFLDQATKTDSNYFLGYYNKLMFYYQLQEFDKAASTLSKLIELKPSAHDLYLMRGILSERIGDTISSQQYFQKSLAICNKVLDTMNVKNSEYEMLIMNKGINLIMLGDSTAGNKNLKQLYDIQTDEDIKQLIASRMNKPKKELLSSIFKTVHAE